MSSAVELFPWSLRPELPDLHRFSFLGLPSRFESNCCGKLLTADDADDTDGKEGQKGGTFAPLDPCHPCHSRLNCFPGPSAPNCRIFIVFRSSDFRAGLNRIAVENC